MPSVLTFTVNWNTWYRVLHCYKGFGVLDSMRFGLWLTRHRGALRTADFESNAHYATDSEEREKGCHELSRSHADGRAAGSNGRRSQQKQRRTKTHSGRKIWARNRAAGSCMNATGRESTAWLSAYSAITKMRKTRFSAVFNVSLTNLTRFREDSTFSTWVTRIAINEALMLLRKRKTNVSLPERGNDEAETSSVLDLTDNAPTPEQAAAENKLHAALAQAISRLRKSLQTVVLLRDLQGLTNEETARRLGLTVSAVKARVFHARRCLRRRLERKLKPARGGFLMAMQDKEPAGWL